MDQIIKMVLRQLVRRGVNSGFRAMSRRGRGDAAQSQEDRQMQREANQSGRSMRQVSRIMRRFTRF